MRKMTAEHRERLARARESRSEQRVNDQSRSLIVAGFRIYRMDDANWCVEKDFDQWYYPSLPWALKSMLERRIGDLATREIKDVLRAINVARREIMEAIGADDITD